MGKKIIFHCGSAKTGSTTFQNFLWAHRQSLAAQGIHYCPRFIRRGNIDPLNIAVRDMKQSNKQADAIKNGRARLAQLFENDGFHTVIISNESAVGDPFSDACDGFFPHQNLALDGLVKMFEGYDVVPVFCIRDQASLLPSFYGQRVRQGAAYSLRDYSEKLQAYDLSWRPVIDRLHARFGTKNFTLLCFEDFSKNPQEYTQKLLSRLLGIDPFKQHQTTVTNRAAKSHAASLMRSCNKMIDHLPRMDKKVKFKLKKKTRRWLFPLLEKIPTGGKLMLPNAVSKDLHLLYQADLDQLLPRD